MWVKIGKEPAEELVGKKTKLSGSPNRSVAVIGDGAMTAGQAFEALNNAGDMDTDLLVILNDNEMSISPNVGAFPKYLAGSQGKDWRDTLRSIKHKSEKVLDKLPGALHIAQKVEQRLKSVLDGSRIRPDSLFDNFGFTYTGPVDGHDVRQLVAVLKEMKQRKGPQLLHVLTQKGQGYKLAENDPVGFHAVGKFNPDQGPVSGGAAPLSYTPIFGQWICDQAAADGKLVAITPAMREGSGLVEFERRFPERYFDVGIAERAVFHGVLLLGWERALLYSSLVRVRQSAKQEKHWFRAKRDKHWVCRRAGRQAGQILDLREGQGAKRDEHWACGKGRAPSGTNTGLAGRTGRKAFPLVIALRQAEMPQRWQVFAQAGKCLPIPAHVRQQQQAVARGGISRICCRLIDTK